MWLQKDVMQLVNKNLHIAFSLTVSASFFLMLLGFYAYDNRTDSEITVFFLLLSGGGNVVFILGSIFTQILTRFRRSHLIEVGASGVVLFFCMYKAADIAVVQWGSV